MSAVAMTTVALNTALAERTLTTALLVLVSVSFWPRGWRGGEAEL